MAARQLAEADPRAGRRRRSVGELLVIAAGFALAMLVAVDVMQQQSATGAVAAKTPPAISRSQH